MKTCYLHPSKPSRMYPCPPPPQGKDYKGKNLYASRAQKKNERQAVLRQKFEELRQDRIAKYQVGGWGGGGAGVGGRRGGRPHC